MSSSTIERVFQLVRDQTGYPVSVTPQADQPSHVSMRSATRSAPVHAIFPNPRYDRYSNYLVVAQCASILLKWSDSEGVHDFVVEKEKSAFLESKIVGRLTRKGTERKAAEDYARAVVSGILMQLNSTPLEILSIDWCFKECPDLRDEQEEYITAHLRELSSTLNPKVREIAPPEIFEKNAAMNAAYALNWSTISGFRTGLIPYETLGLLRTGEQLLGDLRQIEGRTPNLYRSLVDSWATRLHMSGWYTWQTREE